LHKDCTREWCFVFIVHMKCIVYWSYIWLVQWWNVIVFKWKIEMALNDCTCDWYLVWIVQLTIHFTIHFICTYEMYCTIDNTINCTIDNTFHNTFHMYIWNVLSIVQYISYVHMKCIVNTFHMYIWMYCFHNCTYEMYSQLYLIVHEKCIGYWSPSTEYRLFYRAPLQKRPTI